MLLSDTREIKADPKVVWDAILNPEVLKECIQRAVHAGRANAAGHDGVIFIGDFIKRKTVLKTGTSAALHKNT